jgi:hypothetical protein
MAVKTFTKEQKTVQLTEHFCVGDFWAYPGHTSIKFDTVLAQIWEKIYAHFGIKPYLRVYRTGAYKGKTVPSAGFRNAQNWTGSKTSQHCYGKATDVWVPGVPAYKLAQFVETLPEVGGIGLYLAKSGELKKEGHIHIDTRVNRVRWGWNNQTSGTNTPGFGGIPCTFRYNARKPQRSAAIEELQRKLDELGFKCGTPDGVYGENTRNAVMRYQISKKLKADGIYGKETNAVLGLFDW